MATRGPRVPAHRKDGGKGCLPLTNSYPSNGDKVGIFRNVSTDGLAILNYILNGAIIRAVEALHTHFPSVLDDSTPQPHSNGATPTYAPPINGNHTLLHPSHAHQSTSNRPLFSSGPGSDHTLPVFPHSSHPSHVKLNLEIQQFIESFRQLAPSSPSSPSSSISSLTSSMHMSMSNPTNPTASNGTHGTTVTLTHALTAAQGLHAEAKKLPADARAVYLQEIKDVGALFAYTNPETSILKGFLEQGRRIALAEQVNRAILSTSMLWLHLTGLGSQGRSGQPVLYDVAQRTTALYAIMAEREIDPRTNWSTTSAADEHLAAVSARDVRKILSLPSIGSISRNKLSGSTYTTL